MSEKPEGRVVRAKPTTKASSEADLFDAYCRVAYYYPQYNIQQVRKLPMKHVIALLKTAQKEKAAEYLQLLNISAAPHSKKGAGVKKLSGIYEDIVNG